MTHVKAPVASNQTIKVSEAKSEKAEVNKPQKSQGKPSSRGRKKIPIEITDEMKNCISASIKLIENGCSKMDAAKEVLDQLSGYSRSQIIHVFMEGCCLSKAGASTYYQSIKQAKNKAK
jgi:RNase H-fold protein (predicted Holliday junction resolvase)